MAGSVSCRSQKELEGSLGRAAAEEARPTRGLAEAPLLLKRWFPSAGRLDSVARTRRAPCPERAEGSAGISGAQPRSAAAAESRLSVTGTGRKYIGIVSGCAFWGEGGVFLTVNRFRAMLSAAL